MKPLFRVGDTLGKLANLPAASASWAHLLPESRIEFVKFQGPANSVIGRSDVPVTPLFRCRKLVTTTDFCFRNSDHVENLRSWTKTASGLGPFFSRRTWGRISCRNQFTSEFLKISGEQYWDDLRRTFKQPFYSNQFCLVEVRFRSTWAWTTISSRRSKANFNLRNAFVRSFCIAWDPLSFSFSICPLWKSWRTVGSKSRLTVLFFQWVRYTSIE